MGFAWVLGLRDRMVCMRYRGAIGKSGHSISMGHEKRTLSMVRWKWNVDSLIARHAHACGIWSQCLDIDLHELGSMSRLCLIVMWIVLHVLLDGHVVCMWIATTSRRIVIR